MTTPTPITGPCAWYGHDMARSTRWVRDLAPEQVAELDAALGAIERRGLAWYEIQRRDFPLPGLKALLDDVADELENGSGMMKLRGFPVARYTETQLRQLYFGLGANLGTPVFQNRGGELMRLIRDEGAGVGARYGQVENTPDGKPFLSSYARTLSNGALRFHTDRTDVVGLLCVRQAAKGGVSTISSSVAVHNEMIRRRPDLAALLYAPYYRSRHGEEAENNDQVYALPIFGARDGRFTSHFSLTYIEEAQMVSGVPKLTPAQKEALDLLLALARELSFEMTLDAGDIQFLNSHVTYHGRTPFQDDKASGHDRLLMRLWLAMPNSRALPVGQEVLWQRIEAGAVRGGIRLNARPTA
ncbi:MAG TPA: TauD/TfdA family dioxygenase [Stellaceae bacterium]|nr:TauD/TfdA family dioxygenase [Stellaceae bacterium]